MPWPSTQIDGSGALAADFEAVMEGGVNPDPLCILIQHLPV